MTVYAEPTGTASVTTDRDKMVALYNNPLVVLGLNVVELSEQISLPIAELHQLCLKLGKILLTQTHPDRIPESLDTTKSAEFLKTLQKKIDTYHRFSDALKKIDDINDFLRFFKEIKDEDKTLILLKTLRAERQENAALMDSIFHYKLESINGDPTFTLARNYANFSFVVNPLRTAIKTGRPASPAALLTTQDSACPAKSMTDFVLEPHLKAALNRNASARAISIDKNGTVISSYKDSAQIIHETTGRTLVGVVDLISLHNHVLASGVNLVAKSEPETIGLFFTLNNIFESGAVPKLGREHAFPISLQAFSKIFPFLSQNLKFSKNSKILISAQNFHSTSTWQVSDGLGAQSFKTPIAIERPISNTVFYIEGVVAGVWLKKDKKHIDLSRIER